jgi:hypothetical protein
MKLRAPLVGIVLSLFLLTSFSAAARAFQSLNQPRGAQSSRAEQMFARWNRAIRPAQANIPLPPPRPRELAGPEEPLRDAAPAQALTPALPPGDDPETCAAVLASANVVADKIPPIHSGLCGIAHPLMLKAIVLADKRHIQVEPAVAMRCRLAGAVARWITEDVAPIVAASGQALAVLSGAGGYECRGRDGVAGAKLSQHAIGNALDVAALKLVDGHIIGIQHNEMPALLARIRESACARFSTVLGPGADASHNDHLHVDLQERKHGTKICQWDIAPAKGADSAEKNQ